MPDGLGQPAVSPDGSRVACTVSTTSLGHSGSPVHRVQRAEIILDWFAAKLA